MSQNKPKKIIISFDIGTSKVAAVVAGYFGVKEGWKVLGQGMAASEGIKKGRMIQPALALNAVEQARRRAQEAAHVIAYEAVVALPVSVCKGSWREATREFYADRKVQTEDVSYLGKKVSSGFAQERQTVIKSIVHSYKIDDQDWSTEDPVGQMGHRISIMATVFSIDNVDAVQMQEFFKNLAFKKVSFGIAQEALIQKWHELKLALAPEYVQIDIGAGLVQLALVRQQKLIKLDLAPITSNHVLHDIVYGVNVDTAEARRLLMEFGRADGSADPEAMLTVLDDKGEEKTQVSKAYFYRIVNARILELLDFIKQRLSEWEKEGISIPGHLIFAGGLSRLSDLGVLAGHVLNKKVSTVDHKKDIPYFIAEGLILSEKDQINPRSSLFKRGFYKAL